MDRLDGKVMVYSEGFGGEVRHTLKVDVLEDTSDGDWYEFNLRVISGNSEGYLYREGEQFSCRKRKIHGALESVLGTEYRDRGAPEDYVSDRGAFEKWGLMS